MMVKKSQFVINLEKSADPTQYGKIMGYRPDYPTIIYKKPIDKP